MDADGAHADGRNRTIGRRDRPSFGSDHAGDTALFSDMALIAELHAPQFAFLPIGDHFTMGPSAAARACRFLGVEAVVPIHWGTFPILSGTPAALRDELAKLGVACEVIAVAPGESC